MARIAGVNIPTQKRVSIALTYIHGIGRKKAVEICEANQDFVSRDMLVLQIEDTEMDHAYFLEKQIRLIELVGIENYLQSQIVPEPEVQ